MGKEMGFGFPRSTPVFALTIYGRYLIVIFGLIRLPLSGEEPSLIIALIP
ncbi:hypothetical protein [Thermococcus pacificus]|nr:hypothetical protein [Thermococcus pacificus]